MIRALALLLSLSLSFAAPALAQQAHDGMTRTRSMPELSDLALAIFAAGAVWFVRRSLRARFPRD